MLFNLFYVRSSLPRYKGKKRKQLVFKKKKEDLNQSKMYQKSSFFEFGSKLPLRIFISFSEEIMFNSDLQHAEIVYRKNLLLLEYLRSISGIIL